MQDSWRDRQPSEDVLYDDNLSDSHDHLLHSEKYHSPLKRVSGLGTRVSRRTVAFIGALCLLVFVGWAASSSHVRQRISQYGPSSSAGNYSSSAVTSPAKSIARIPAEGSAEGTWKKPEGFQIQGLVFYGRRIHVDILDCYLQQNLAKNGGYLDGVIFLQNTDDAEDIAYLEQLLAREPAYTRLDVGADVRHWKHMWDQDFDENTMYFKIDDDLVYIHPDAIPQMVHTLLEHPEAHNVQANIVNSASTSWQHYHAGAVRPYLPERVKPQQQQQQQQHAHNASAASWRASELPAYPSEIAKDTYDFEHAEKPYNGHRWLPLEESSAALMKTPIQGTENYAWGRDWTQWAIAAQHHYSLFGNIEADTMDRYIFGNGEGVFNPQYERYKINLMGIWGHTLNIKKVVEDDEREFTEEIPKELKMPVLVQTKAIVAHFSFEPQRDLYRTDLLSRYRAYANERVCAPNNQKKEFPDWVKTLEKWGVPQK